MILLVEDDRELASLIQEHLSNYAVIHSLNAQEALDSLAFNRNIRLIILDLTLPDMDGLDLCVQMRKKYPDIKIIISSARNSIEDKLRGLDKKCANDYIVKPYDPRELEARIVQLLPLDNDTSSVFEIDTNNSKVYKCNQEIPFTKAEYEIFKLLFLNKNQYFSRESIANSISSHHFNSMLESISMLLSKVRKKIDEEKEKESYIKNRRGVGYFFHEK